MLNEKWLCIKDFPKYQVSNLGRVKNSKGQIMKSKIENGMYRVCLKNNDKTSSKLVKRLVLEAFVGINKDLNILNIDGDITNCRLDNLKYIEKVDKYEYIENLPGEEWRDIKDFPNYKVSNMGRVKSIKQTKEILLKLQYKKRTGYVTIILYNEKGSKDFRVHRLVASAFLDNDDPINKTEVNHKDEDKTNNVVENLEWCTKKYNINYGNRNEKAAEKNRGKRNIGLIKRMKRVRCITTGKEFDCLVDAAKYYGIKAPHQIVKCIKGEFKRAGTLPDGTPLIWEFIENSEVTE